MKEPGPTERLAGLRLNAIDARITRGAGKHRRQKRIDGSRFPLDIDLDVRVDILNRAMNVKPPRNAIDRIAKPNPLHDPMDLDDAPNRTHARRLNARGPQLLAGIHKRNAKATSMFDLSLAIGHHLLIFALFGVLVAELILVRPPLDTTTIARTARIDIWYGIIAGLIVIVGFTRAIFAAKGWAYYEHNLFFWAKITTFVIIAVLSIPPTIRYLHWQRTGTTPPPAEIVTIRRLLWTEVALFALLPILAAAMARDFGEYTY